MGLLIKNGLIITSCEEFLGDILIEGEKIKSIGSHLSEKGHNIVDATGKYIFPGGVDEHVHMGSFDTDGFETSHAAVVGGTTTIVDFAPQFKDMSVINSVKKQHQEYAKGYSTADYSLHGMVMDTSEKLLDEIPRMPDNGISTLKFFMAYKFTPFMVSDELIFKAMQIARDYGITIMVHAENGDIIHTLQQQLIKQGKKEPIYHAYSRPPIVEEEATSRIIYLAELAKCPLFIVHVSTKGAMAHIKKAREKGLPIYGETCTHYLTLDETYLKKPEFEGAKYVCSPPLRTKEHLESLWDGLKKGYITGVGSDHASVSGGFKKKHIGLNDFTKIPNGCPGFQERLTMLWTQGVETGKISRKKLVEIFSTNPAKTVGIYPQKGALLPGSDADIVIFNPTYSGKITLKDSYEETDYCLWDGFDRKGRVERVYLRGKLMAENGKLTGEKGNGIYIRPKPYGLCYENIS